MYCAPRVVIELDGAQHLASGRVSTRSAQAPATAGERVLVLRLLADDVANELDTILDAVLHSLTLRRDAGRSPLLTVERRTPA
ncbi:MAG: hypothetical protein DMF93_21730 [Acidobacteria bacterium]|nr:MAG: hypothetical protein DMF93_21730 [Acidobacteriota bacterium]